MLLKCLAVCFEEDHKYPQIMIKAKIMLGEVYEEQSELDKASEYYEQALEHQEITRDQIHKVAFSIG